MVVFMLGLDSTMIRLKIFLTNWVIIVLGLVSTMKRLRILFIA